MQISSSHRPKQCVNRNCTTVLYVPHYHTHLPLQCGRCIKDKETRHGNKQASRAHQD